MKPHNCLLSRRVILLLAFTSFSFSAVGQATNTSSFIQKEFKFSTEDYHLDGRLLLPDTLRRHPVILNIWGSGPTRMEHFIENSQILSRLTDSGYAVLIYDKPGYGASRGTLEAKTLLHDRARIAAVALEKLKNSRYVIPERVGLYGSSQAAYVMSLILKNTKDLGFAVCWSCPMENSIDQSSYQIQQYLLCAGKEPELAVQAGERYIKALLARDYKTYLPNAVFLSEIPGIRDELGWGEVLSKTAWKPIDPDSEELLDPARIFSQATIPILAIYGTLDKNINPHQAVGFLSRQENENLKTTWIPNADHNMMVGGNGCIQEQIKGYKSVQNPKRSELFETTLITWLVNLEYP